jgi:hypothetical protein
VQSPTALDFADGGFVAVVDFAASVDFAAVAAASSEVTRASM